MLRTYQCLMLFFCSFLAQAQEDTLLLNLYELAAKDIEVQESTFNQQKVVSGSRTLQNVDDLPLTIYVVTKEEIQKYGYVTLVDVLKHLPGIRVSQPGTALEGETFLMRGLKGNSYAKIMINNIAIKPAVASGMPIGAQLPIQQADRIEVIYGPAAAVYGADASAGIINIILEKKERPVYAQARLNAGASQGYTDFNLLFGGKIGRNKGIINFSVYGSTTILDDRDINYDPSLFNPLNYARTLPNGNLDTSYVHLQNFTGTTATVFNSSTIPHLSRMFGVDFYYKNWSVSFQRMYRRDHSSIGLNPMAVSYGNPLSYFGENITSVNFGYSRRKKKFGVDLNFSYLGYKVDNRSSTQYINPSLFQAMDLQLRSASFDTEMMNFDALKYDSLRTSVYDYYFSGNRSSYAFSDEFGIEQIYTFALRDWVELSLGLNGRLSNGFPLVTLSDNPDIINNFTATDKLPLPLVDYFRAGASSFLQAYFKQKKWNMTLGIQGYAYGILIGGRNLPGLNGLNPRLAFLYKLKKDWSIRAFYGKAFRVPSPYYYVNTFRVDADTDPLLEIAGLPLAAENTTAYELGMRWQTTSKIRMDIVAFYNYTDNFISYNFNNNINNLEDINSTVGYFNNASSAISISGIQATIDYNNIIPRWNLDARLNVQYASSFETQNQNFFAAQEVPAWSASAIVSIRPFTKFSMSLLNVYQGESAVNRQDEYEFGYYLLDGVFRYDLSDKFQALIKMNNVFNTPYSGLLATRSSDDLYYNPQNLRNIQIGFSYKTN